MIVTVRIYKRHDPDLISLIENYEFDIRKAVFCALSGYMKKEAFVISLPPKGRSLIKQAGGSSEVISGWTTSKMKH